MLRCVVMSLGGIVSVDAILFDPRSARLNTELGFIIDSPAWQRR
jgi:hypothetical protein